MRRREQAVSKNESNAPPLAIEAIAGRILLLRGQRVMLDVDLAALYGISTGRFNEAVRRNLARFPGDFMFPLTNQDLAALRSQIATLKAGRGQHRKYPPYAFTEHGAIMAATILNSPRATLRRGPEKGRSSRFGAVDHPPRCEGDASI